MLGNKILQYQIIEKLGQGGMATVWKVYDEVSRKDIALKEIKRKINERAGRYLIQLQIEERRVRAHLKVSLR